MNAANRQSEGTRKSSSLATSTKNRSDLQTKSATSVKSSLPTSPCDTLEPEHLDLESLTYYPVIVKKKTTPRLKPRKTAKRVPKTKTKQKKAGGKSCQALPDDGGESETEFLERVIETRRDGKQRLSRAGV